MATLAVVPFGNGYSGRHLYPRDLVRQVLENYPQLTEQEAISILKAFGGL